MLCIQEYYEMTGKPSHIWRVTEGQTQVLMLYYRQKKTRLQGLCKINIVLFILIIKVIHGHCARLWQYKEIF